MKLAIIEPDPDDALLSCKWVLERASDVTLITVSSFNGRTSQKLKDHFKCIKEVMHLEFPHFHWENRVSHHELKKAQNPTDFLYQNYVLNKNYALKPLCDIISQAVIACNPEYVLVPCGIMHPMHFVTAEASNIVLSLMPSYKTVLYREWPYGSRVYGQKMWDFVAKESGGMMELKRKPDESPRKSDLLLEVYPTESFLVRPPYNPREAMDGYEEAYIGPPSFFTVLEFAGAK